MLFQIPAAVQEAEFLLQARQQFAVLPELAHAAASAFEPAQLPRAGILLSVILFC